MDSSQTKIYLISRKFSLINTYKRVDFLIMSFSTKIDKLI